MDILAGLKPSKALDLKKLLKSLQLIQKSSILLIYKN